MADAAKEVWITTHHGVDHGGVASLFFMAADLTIGWSSSSSLDPGAVSRRVWQWRDAGELTAAARSRWTGRSSRYEETAESVDDEALVHRPRLLELRGQGGGGHQGHGQAAGLEHLFEEVVVPTERVVEVRRGRKFETERKLFPGYVFVKMEMTDAALVMIKNTPKVTGFLGNDNKPRSRSPTPKPRRMLNRVKDVVESAAADRDVRDRRDGAASRPGRSRASTARSKRSTRNARAEGGCVHLRSRNTGGARLHRGAEAARPE